MFLLEREEELLGQLKNKNPLEARKAREELHKLDFIEKLFAEFDKIVKKESVNHPDIGEILDVFYLLRDKKCMPYLIKVIRQATNAYKNKAIQILAIMPDPAALNTLLVALKLYDDEVKAEALKIINLLKTSSTIEPLFTATDVENQEMTEEILKLLKQYQANQLKEVAIKLLHDEDQAHARKARTIMEHLFGKEKTEFIVEEYFGERTVLISDKLQTQRSTLVKYFSDSGFKVVGDAATPEETVKICHEKRPDIVVMELCQPSEEHGIIVISALKKVNPEVGIILCTGSSNREKIEKAISTGASSCVSKPADKGLLINSSKDYLQKRANKRTAMK